MAIKKFSPQKYSKAQIEQAKRMYMSFEPAASISRQTDIPRSTLRYYIRESWKEERMGDATDLVNQITAGQIHMLRDISVMSLDTIYNSISEIRDAKKVLPIRDLERLANLLAKLDEIAVLSKLSNPEGPGDEDGDYIDMEEASSLDPFAVEVKEIEEKS